MPLKSKRKRGRPRLPRGEGKRHPLNMRTTKDVRDRLEAAATESGRSLAQEVEFRLQESFSNELTYQVFMGNIYEQFGGKGIYYLMKLLALAMATSERETGKSWQDDADTCALVEAVFNSVLSRYVPESVRPTKPADPQQSKNIAAVLVGGLEGSRTRAQLDEDRKRKLED